MPAAPTADVPAASEMATGSGISALLQFARLAAAGFVLSGVLGALAGLLGIVPARGRRALHTAMDRARTRRDVPTHPFGQELTHR
jgi:hypothetical protein